MEIQINATPGMSTDPPVKPTSPPGTTAQRGSPEPRAAPLAAAPRDPPKEAVAKPPRVNEKQLSESVSQINDFVQNIQRHVVFSIHEESGLTVVEVRDQETDVLVRQFPAEAALAMASKIREQMDEHLIFEGLA